MSHSDTAELLPLDRRQMDELNKNEKLVKIKPTKEEETNIYNGLFK